MKIALNRCFGGFSLSKECLKMVFDGLGDDERKRLFEKPWMKNPNADPGDYVLVIDGMCWHPKYDSVEFRTHHWVIRCIEELGIRANGPCADIEISNIVSEIEINDYDGRESVSVVGGKYV